MSNKIKVGVVYGGRSPEHKISLLSAMNVVHNMDRTRFEPILLPIDKDGIWHYNDGEMRLENKENAATISLPRFDNVVYLSQNTNEGLIIDKESGAEVAKIDVLFPVMHGEYGEDGSIQGFAKVAGLPCVGCGILGSSAGMDKDVTKRLLRDFGIGVAGFVTLRKGFNDAMSYEEISDILGKELFIKPANLGSSVGVSFVDNAQDFDKAVKMGFSYDPKVLVEEKISGREIECAVLGNENPQASVIGEILPKTGWYTFDSKYIDDDGAGLAIPALMSDELSHKARSIAIDTYIALECCGLTRVDMFLKENGDIIVNEVNTFPGFTKISMYPKLWEYSGIPYSDLVTKLIELAMERYSMSERLVK